MKHIKLLFVLLITTNVFAGSVIMEKTQYDFSHTWLNLQKYTKKQGYNIGFKQRCDLGLKKMHYKSNKYRILFFGKYQEMKDITKRNPEITPHLPLAITSIESYDDKNVTTLVSASPKEWLNLVKSKEDKAMINRWHLDILQIIKNTQNDFAE
jgi:uncharacterized protein (DUF302 family)